MSLPGLLWAAVGVPAVLLAVVLLVVLVVFVFGWLPLPLLLLLSCGFWCRWSWCCAGAGVLLSAR